MSIAYKIGHSIGSNPKEWAIGSLAAILVIAGLTTLDSYSTQQAQKSKEAEAQARAVRLQEEQVRRQAEKVAMCTEGIEKLKQEAKEFMRQGKPGPAANVLGACETLMQDGQARVLLADAKKAREAEERKAQKVQAAQQAKLDAAEKARKKREGVSIGMTRQDVLDSSWGKPKRVNRTIAAYGVHEQWVYEGGYLYFKDGTLTTIQN